MISNLLGNLWGNLKNKSAARWAIFERQKSVLKNIEKLTLLMK